MGDAKFFLCGVCVFSGNLALARGARAIPPVAEGGIRYASPALHELLRDGHKLQLSLKMPEIDTAQQKNEN
jgi:hypothetical protein